MVSAKRTRARPARVLVPPGARSRRVVLKARYVSMAHASALRAAQKHLDYVQRDGVDRDGGKGVLYGREAHERIFEAQAVGEDTRGSAAPAAVPEEQPLVTPVPSNDTGEAKLDLTERLRQSMLRPIPGEKHQFRIIISAEDAGRLDLTDFITRVMERVERDLGQPLIWAAANHHDTDDPHTHLVIRGVDRNGRAVRFDREYISRTWRERAQEIVTQELGPRTEQEIERQLQREVEQGRYTSLDRAIAARAIDGVVRSTDLKNAHQRARLKTLAQMGLAEQQDARHWKLQEGWQAKLKADGERGDIIKQMYKALGERLDTGRYRILKRFEPMPGKDEVTGRVVELGLVDSTPGALYAVVETTQGEGYYVPLWPSEVASLKRGDFVTLKQLKDSWLKPLDTPLADLARDTSALSAEGVAQAMRGRLDELCQAGLATRTERGTWKLKADFRERWAKQARLAYPTQGRIRALDELLELGSPKPGEVDVALAADVIAKRLKELEELGLGTSAPAGTVLDPHLVKSLEQRDVDRPQAHVAMRRQPMSVQAQVHYRGPTWLDTADLDTECPLGREVRQLRDKRGRFLEHIGITTPERRERMRVLVKLERDELAERLAQKRDRGPATKLEGFQGRVVEVHQAPSGNRYAVVENDSELILVRAGSKARKLVGRAVEVQFVVSEYDGKPKLTLVPILERQRGR